MKEASWKECLENNTSIKISSNKAKASSLIETARDRIKFIEKIKINKSNARFLFENYYSSLTEIIHAILIIEGFKVSNHLCLGFYLRDELKRKDLFLIFDDCRYKRNSIVYYGKGLNFEVAKESISKIKEIIKELEVILKI